MKRAVIILMTVLMLFSLFQGASRENMVKADSQPIWPMPGYNSQHTGQCPYDTSQNNGKLKWKFQTDGGIASSSTPTIGSDGTIYIMSSDLYAINPDGTLKWRYQTDNYYIVSSPVIGSDGTIYVAADDRCLYAIGGTFSTAIITASVEGIGGSISPSGTITVKYVSQKPSL